MRALITSLSLQRVILLAVALTLSAATSQAEVTAIPHGTLELISENAWIAPGHRTNLGLRFQLEKGWHIYWINPGDSGEPPRVNWQFPEGLTAGAIEWPAPRRLGSSTVVDFGYEDAVTLIVPIYAEPNVGAQNQVQLGANVSVLVCREMCIPGKARLSLILAIKPQPPVTDNHTEDAFAATRKSLPRAVPPSWRFTVVETNDSFVLTAANLGRQVTEATLFPLVESQISNAAPQRFTGAPGGFRIVLRKSDQLLRPLDRLSGVLVISGYGAYSIDVPVGKAGAATVGHGAGIHSSRSLQEETTK